MPVQPRFNITQDDEFLYIEIKTPYVRVSSMDFVIIGCDFSFFCNPYLLKLQFPCPCIEDDRCKADNGTITVHLPKLNKGEVFPDLDLQSKLLVKKTNVFPTKPSKPLIEVIGGDENDENDNNDEENNEEEEEKEEDNKLDDFISSNMSELEIDKLKIDNTIYYGFGNKYSKFFSNLHEDLPEIIELSDPDEIPENQRRIIRNQKENEQFHSDRYIADFIDGRNDPIFIQAMEYKPQYMISRKQLYSSQKHWCEENKSNDIPKDLLEESSDVLSKEDNEIILKLPKYEYIFSHTETLQLLNDLVGILSAYAYDLRTTEGEATVESSWTISILSPLFSYLETIRDLKDLCLQFLRRVLTHPYMRRWDLGIQCLKDAQFIFFCGRKRIIKTLLNIREIFGKSDQKYLLNTLYIDHYILWIQTLPPNICHNYSNSLKLVINELSKDQIDFPLVELDKKAKEIVKSMEEDE